MFGSIALIMSIATVVMFEPHLNLSIYNETDENIDYKYREVSHCFIYMMLGSPILLMPFSDDTALFARLVVQIPFAIIFLLFASFLDSRLGVDWSSTPFWKRVVHTVMYMGIIFWAALFEKLFRFLDNTIWG